VASPFAILPLPPSQFRPLAPYCPLSWHLTAKNSSPGWHPSAPPPLAGTLLLTFLAGIPSARWLRSRFSLPLRSFGPSSVTPSRGIALPPWLCPTLGNDVMTCPTVHVGFRWALNLSVFPCWRSSILSPRPRKGLRTAVVSFVLGSLLKGLGLSTCMFLCIVSLRVWGILS